MCILKTYLHALTTQLPLVGAKIICGRKSVSVLDYFKVHVGALMF